MMVEEGRVTVPLWSAGQVTDPSMDNRRFIRDYVMDLLCKSFPNLTPYVYVFDQTSHHTFSAQVNAFVVGLFDLRKDFNQFCTHLRDFLVQLKEFSGGDDNANLFFSEQEAEKQRQLQQELAIPGLIGPHDPRRNQTQ